MSDDHEDKQAQRNMILRHLKAHGGISTWEAIFEYGITRLSRCIYDIKHIEGISITDEWETRENRYGKPIKFKRYRIQASDVPELRGASGPESAGGGGLQPGKPIIAVEQELPLQCAAS